MKPILLKRQIITSKTSSFPVYTVRASNNNLMYLLGFYLMDLSRESEVDRIIQWLLGDDVICPNTEYIGIDKEEGGCYLWDVFEEDENGSFKELFELSEKNMLQLLNVWKEAVVQKKKYMIVNRDNEGWVSVDYKDQLSDEEKKHFNESDSNSNDGRVQAVLYDE